MDNNQEYSGGIGFLGALTVVFITLRLCKVISWPWFWVLSPTLLPLIIVLLVVVIAWIWYLVTKQKL